MMTKATVETIRSFIAIPLEDALKKRLALLQQQLRQQFPGLRPATPDNLHLTLHFLGERTHDELAEIGRIMLSIAEKKKIFNVSLEGLGVFPNSRRPRVLWIGLSPPDNLIDLYTLLREEMEQVGIQADRKPYRPHLTLGRFKDPKQKAISLGHFMTHSCCTIQVDSLVLFSSRLSAKGAVHTPLSTARLASAGV